VTRIPATLPSAPPRSAPRASGENRPQWVASVEERPGFKDLGRTQGVEQECYRCHQVVRGRVYCFVAGFYEGTTQKAIHAHVRIVSDVYRNLERHGIFLCPGCARAVVQWTPMVFSLVSGMIALFLLLIGTGLLLTSSNHFMVRNVCLIAGAVFFIVFGIGLWNWLTMTADRETVEQSILPIARRKFRHLGDTFWTWTEHQKNRKLMED
jgi:hypothetical protein